MVFFRKRKKHDIKVIILGGPRSGTSFLTSVVSRMGYHLGPKWWLKRADKHNPHGYFECKKLMKISMGIINKMGGDFHENLPDLSGDWTRHFKKEKDKIRAIVNRGKIDLYKDNFMLVLADLYDELYPDAHWIYIERDEKDTHNSRFGRDIEFFDIKNAS